MLFKFSPLLIFILSLNIYSFVTRYVAKYYAFDELLKINENFKKSVIN